VTNIFDVERFSGDPIRYLAVKHSVEPGRERAAEYIQRMIAG
jgi:hypothetical protein